MPFAHAWPKGRLIVAASVLAIAAAVLPASADTRAPIVYAMQPGAPAKAASKAAVVPLVPDKATQRIAFRYPGSGEAPPAVSPAPQTVWTSPKPLAPVAAAPVVETVALQPVGVAKPVQAAAVLTTSASETGLAIVYGDEFDGLPTSNGEIFDQNALTAAHPSLPLPSVITVRNPQTGREVTLRVNDRGPFEEGAVLQVSRKAAQELGMSGAGRSELTFFVAGQSPAPVSRPAAGPKPLLREATVRAQPADELLGGDELAGAPAPAKQRAAVVWPEPPAEWGVGPRTTKISASSSGSLYVQLASFADINNAEALYRGLRSDLPVEIVPARVNGSEYFRVRVGPLTDRASAQDLRDRLNAEGKGDGRVVTAE